MDLYCTKPCLKVAKKGGVADFWDTHAAAPYERLKGMTASSAAATTIKLHRKIVYLSASVGCGVPGEESGAVWWLVVPLGAAETIKLHLHFSGENETELNQMKQRKLQKRAPKSIQQLLF